MTLEYEPPLRIGKFRLSLFNRLLDVSSGIDEFSEWCGDQIDHGYEGVDIAVAPGPSSGGLEDTVEGLEAGIVVV